MARAGIPGHLHTQTTRLRNAADALVAARDEFASRVAPTDPATAGLYTGRVLAADDLFGSASGLVVQGDAVGWASVRALEVLARHGQAAHRRDDPHGPGVTPLTCPLCAAVFALGVHLVDGIDARSRAGVDAAVDAGRLPENRASDVEPTRHNGPAVT